MLPISVIKKILDKKLGEGSWHEYETETLILELDLPYSELLHDKVSVLKVIENVPKIFFDDIIFLIYAAEVMNNTPADFSHLPHITSLELAFAITEIGRVFELETHLLPEFTAGPRAFIKGVLVEEGYSVVLPPFDIVGVGELEKGQEPGDTTDKAKAIEDYIHAMYNQ